MNEREEILGAVAQPKGMSTQIKQSSGTALTSTPIILVVDDDENTREALKALFELEGYHVETAANGEEGLARLADAPRPSLVLLDLSMPSIDGYEFRERQLSSSQIAGIPVVVCSAHLDTKRGERLAAAAYLSKPVDVSRLRRLVANLCPLLSH